MIVRPRGASGSRGLAVVALERPGKGEFCAQSFEDTLGEAVTVASVPTGFYDARVVAGAASAGFTDIFTSDPWTSPLLVEGTRVHGRFAIVAGTDPAHVLALA